MRWFQTQLVAAMAAISSATHVPAVHMPLHLNFGGNEKISTDLYIASANETIEVVYDTGSENFIVFGPGAVDHWGSSSIGVQGPCSAPVPRGSFFNYSSSPTASVPVSHSASYVYGGADKIYIGSVTVNDSFAFYGQAGPDQDEALTNVRVQLIDSLTQRVSDPNCSYPPLYDLGILGISPYYSNRTVGPHFRQDLLERGVIGAPVQSIWFDEAPDSVYGTYTGGGLLGGIDTTKYSGDLVKVKTLQPAGAVGYYTPMPNITVNGISFAQPTSIDNCLLDSGTHDDTVPVAWTEDDKFNNATGMVVSPKGYTAWPGECDTIPADRTIDYTFAGISAGESVTIKVPMRAYVRVDYSTLDPGYCLLSVSTGGCLLGAPFASASFFAADDDAGQIALARGGISKPGAGIDWERVVERIP